MPLKVRKTARERTWAEKFPTEPQSPIFSPLHRSSPKSGVESMEASRVIRRRAALFAGAIGCAAALVPAAAASAAYAPHLAIKFAPATPGKPVAITSVLTQAAGETPSKTVTVSFPPGFLVNAGTKAQICQPD